MKHYVVIHDYAVELGEVTSTGVVITAVAHTPEEAKMILAKASSGERDYAYENHWNIRTDNDNEFDAGEENNYDREHSHFYIEEVDDYKLTINNKEEN